MKKNNELLKRRMRYLFNNNFVCKIFMRLYYEFKELVWLGLCIVILVVILKMFFLPF